MTVFDDLDAHRSTPAVSASEVWAVPAYLPYLQPELTAGVVRRAETKLGVTLPRSYLDLLAVQNGGYVRRKLPKTVHSMIWGIGPHFPSITSDPWYADLVDQDCWLPEDPHLLVPFDGDGHWYLCFDYRRKGPTAEPTIAFIDVELEHESVVAKSFASFLLLLEEDISPGTLGITGDIELASAVAALESALGVRFDPPDSWAHGYAICGCRLSDEPPELIWLSENRVPRGFIRKTDPRYKKLRHKLPGTALRIPQHPEVALVLECTEAVANQARAACEQASLPFVQLRPSR